MHDPLGAAPPPEPPARERCFSIFDLRNVGVWAQLGLKKLSVRARFGGFLSERQLVSAVQYGMACRFCKVWRGYPCNLCPWKQQNSEISMEFEGSEAGTVKFNGI